MLKSKGFAILQVICGDPQALLILLNIVHCRNKQVPRSIDRQLLYDIAVLVDYHGFDEATEVFSDIWLRELNREDQVAAVFTNTYGMDISIRKSVENIWISMVFDDSGLFEKATRQTIRISTGPMPTYGHPFPTTLIGKEPRYSIKAVICKYGY